jgi:hypothetical protein
MDTKIKTRERVRSHRQRMRAQGMKPITIWVPDVNAPGFAEECRRQAKLAAEDPASKEVQDWLDSVQEWPEY